MKAIQGLGTVDVNVPNPSTGTLSIEQNGTFDVTDYAEAQVNVSGTYPVKKYNVTIDDILGNVDENGVLQPANTQATLIFSGVKSFNQPLKFFRGSSLKGVELPDLEAIPSASNNTSSYLEGAFFNTKITNFSAPKLTTVGNYGCYELCRNSSNLATINLPELTSIGNYGLYAAFSGTQIQNIEFPKLTTVGNNGLNLTFNNIGYYLKSLSFPNLTEIKANGLYNMCNGSYSTFSVSMPKLASIGSSGLYYAFASTSLKTLSFPALSPVFYLLQPSRSGNSYIVATNQFNNMLTSVNNCVVHFPSNLEEVIGEWDSVVNGFGGTNTTVLFDLEPVAIDYNWTIDEDGVLTEYILSPEPIVFEGVKNVGPSVLYGPKGLIWQTETVSFPDLEEITNESALEKMCYYNANLTSFSAPKLKRIIANRGARDLCGYCPKLQSIDLSALEELSGNEVFRAAFYSSTPNLLTSVNFNSLKKVSGSSAMTNAFYNNANLTDIYFPSFNAATFENITSAGSSFNPFYNMLYNTTGVTVHLPSNVEEIVNNIPGASSLFGGNSTTILFDLPATE